MSHKHNKLKMNPSSSWDTTRGFLKALTFPLDRTISLELQNDLSIRFRDYHRSYGWSVATWQRGGNKRYTHDTCTVKMIMDAENGRANKQQ